MSGGAVDHELLWLSGIEQAELIRSRQISSRELVDATLARIDALDAKVGAFITLNAEQARRDAAYADEHPTDRPLHGVPLCVKDLISTKGLRTTHGSSVHRDFVPDHDAPTVTRMREAGAIVIGKANTPEFGLAAETFTMFGPRACNPHDLSRTTGGSSGGTAAAIAAGMSAIGLGSDAGGSIRLPAAWCGVSGLKPTYGRVPIGRRNISSRSRPTTLPLALARREPVGQRDPDDGRRTGLGAGRGQAGLPARCRHVDWIRAGRRDR